MINVYFLETQYRYLGWHDVFLELVLHLKDNYKANIIHQKGGWLRIEKYDYDMPDCEILIEDTDRDILRGISFSETRTKMLDIFESRKNKNDVLLQTQFYSWFPKNFDRNVFDFKLKGTTFYTFMPSTNHEYYYNQRRFKKKEDLIDKLFFLFTTHREDGIKLRELGICSPAQGNLTIDQYLDQAINYKIGLSIASVAEISYREIEYMAVGLPNMHLEYMTQLNPSLIPNYHYISVDRGDFPWDSNLDRNGGPEYVEAYRKRFYEVNEDYEFLEYISRNARDYYTQYCSPENRVKHIVNQLELQ
jgi:hypothetical protein